MKISQVIQYRDMCSVCGQTPCNCTHISEGRLHNPDKQDSPVAQAIIRRILLQRTDLLSKYGPGYVGQAVDDVADSVGDVEEIGSSDVSGWVKQVEWNLKNKLNQYDEPINVGDALDEQGVAEGLKPVTIESKLEQSLKALEEAVATTQPAAAPAATVGQQADAAQQRILDRMGARFGLPPGSSMEQVQAAQQAYLDKNDPAAAAQFKQQMTNIDAGQTFASQKPIQLAPKPAPAQPAPAQPAAQQAPAQPAAQQAPAQTAAQPAAQPAPAQPAAKPNLGADWEAGMAAKKAGGDPIDMMLAQPSIANNQKMLDALSAALGYPAGTTKEQLIAAQKAKKSPQAAGGANQAQNVKITSPEQKAIDDMAKKQGFPAGLTKDQFYKMYQDKLNKQRAAPAPAAQPTAPVAEGKRQEKEADYGPDYQDMVARVKKLAGLGPLKTVWDEKKRVYKNVPVAVQPAQQPKKEQR